MNNENNIYIKALKQLLWLCVSIAVVRFSKGGFLFIMMLLGVMWALRGSAGKAIAVNAMMLLMVAINPVLLPKDGALFGLGLRFGPLVVGLALALKGASVNNRYRIPFGMMLVYLAFAMISSATGWAPMISYMKIANFVVFFLGVWLGSQSLSKDLDGIATVRACFLAICCFLILGSLVLLPFPGISTLNSLAMLDEEIDASARNAIIREMIDSGGMTLFCGVTNQSQALSLLLSCAFAWLLCDLLFVEERFRWLHALMLLSALPLLYKTRSRVALLCLAVVIIIVYFYLPRRMQMGARVRRWLGGTLAVTAILGCVAAGYMQITDESISKWIRKTNDVEGDRRSLQEAFTSSREGLIEMCMSDFKAKPLIGMGFQVAFYTREQIAGRKGLILSASIEKGVLPIMILGETGLLGAFSFLMFLVMFYSGCVKRRLYLCLSLMGILLTANMGEATFFSPGGIGGVEWMLTVVGGYALDLWRARYMRSMC